MHYNTTGASSITVFVNSYFETDELIKYLLLGLTGKPDGPTFPGDPGTPIGPGGPGSPLFPGGPLSPIVTSVSFKNEGAPGGP